MIPALLTAMVVLASIAALVAGGRANELFCLSVRDGRVLLVRGRIPARLRRALEEHASEARIARATIRAVYEGDTRLSGRGCRSCVSIPYARLVLDGVDVATAQRMRNAMGQVAVPAITSAPLERDRNLGQRLGVAWLAWRGIRRS